MHCRANASGLADRGDGSYAHPPIRSYLTPRSDRNPGDVLPSLILLEPHHDLGYWRDELLDVVSRFQRACTSTLRPSCRCGILRIEVPLHRTAIGLLNRAWPCAYARQIVDERPKAVGELSSTLVTFVSSKHIVMKTQ